MKCKFRVGQILVNNFRDNYLGELEGMTQMVTKSLTSVIMINILAISEAIMGTCFDLGKVGCVVLYILY